MALKRRAVPARHDKMEPRRLWTVRLQWQLASELGPVALTTLKSK